jgi:hypothetical protein
VDALAGKIEVVHTRGLATDLEIPLRYLLEGDATKPLSLAVIVSDGEPEIWDEKRPFLSKRVRTDQRYDDLNARYRSLKTEGRDPEQIYELLHADYQARNIKLIEARLAGIKERFGNKLVFLDVSGASEFFKNWAKAAGSEYIAIAPQMGTSPVERLREALVSFKQKAVVIVEESPPEGKESALEIPLELEPEPVPEPTLMESQPPQGEQVDTVEENPETVQPKMMPEPMEEPAPVVPLIETQAQIPKPKTDEKSPLWWATLILLLIALAIVLYFSVMRGKGGEKEELAGKTEAAGAASTKDMTRFIDKEMDRVLKDADELRSKLIKEKSEKFKFERRIDLRIPVPSGSMEVRWTNKMGETKSGPALQISMNAVMIDAGDFDGDGIDSIICPGLGLTLRVKRSDIRQRDDGKVVAMLEEFEDNVEDRMKWIETLTRIETPGK